MSEAHDKAKEEIASALGGYSEEELRKLAVDYVEGKIFTNFHLRQHDQDLLGMIFMPLILGAASFAQDAWMVFEYYDQAGPRGVNGYPIFFSVRKIIQKDAPAFRHYVTEYEEMKKKFFAQPIPEKLPGS
jgi:hypothetical protein